MRVGVDLTWMAPGVVGGSEAYTTSHLRALVEHAPWLEMVLFVRPDFASAHPDLAAAAPTDVVRGTGSRALRVAAQSTGLARAARHHRVDVMAHLGGTIPWRRAAPTLLTVYDLQWVDHPQYFSPVKRAYLRREVPRSVRVADRIITESAFVEGTIRALGEVTTPIEVIGPAIGPTAPALDDAAAERALAAAGVRRPFVLYPAITYPHKDHVVLVEALAAIPAADRPMLVLTGGPGSSEPAVELAVRQRDVGADVRRLGRVPEILLDTLYRAAAGVVFPSRYEGFGMGVVEAMARGTPVAAARATALPEVVGDAGLLVEPGDVAAWSAAIGRLVAGPDRSRLVEAGRRLVARLAPAVVAERLATAIAATSESGPTRR